jgi:hypothetical protein
MNIENFINECNRSPVFKNYPSVTKNSLKSVGFIKKDYELNDINTASRLLFFIPPKLFLNTSKAYTKQNRKHKDLQHLYGLDLEKNKERIREIRKALNMPYEHCGMTSIQFEELMDKISLNEIEVKEKIKLEIQRFSKMQKFFLGTKEKISIPSVDIRGYEKYVLREGANEEKREILGCFKSRIYLAEKKIILEK